MWRRILGGSLIGWLVLEQLGVVLLVASAVKFRDWGIDLPIMLGVCLTLAQAFKLPLAVWMAWAGRPGWSLAWVIVPAAELFVVNATVCTDVYLAFEGY